MAALQSLFGSVWTFLRWFNPDRTLAIVAISFATKQYFDARQANQKMADHSEKMQDIGKSMSTRFIGTFPDDMPEIKNIVDSANTRLDIMVDYLGYGHFSSPAIFRSYLSQLLEKHRTGVKLRIIIYAESLLLQSNASEFPAGEFKQLQTSREFVDFFKVHCKGLQPPEDAETFRNILVDRQHAYLAEALVAGVEIRVVSQELVVFCWAQDSEDAVFSFRSAGIKDNREVAFRTRDGKLIDTFTGLFERTWIRAQPLSHSSTSTSPISECAPSASQAQTQGHIDNAA